MSKQAVNFKKKTDWSTFDKFWVISVCFVAISVSIYTNNGWLAACAAITGVIDPVLAAKGKSLNWIVGLINVLIYGYIAYNNQIYGMAFLNIMFYAPLQFVGYYKWNKVEKNNDISQFEEVKSKRLDRKQWITSIASCCIITLISYFICILFINSSQPLLDSLVVSISIVGNFVMIYMFIEQWYFWIIVNILSIVLWITAMGDSDTPTELIPLIIMNLAKIGNSIFGIYSWKIMEKRQNENLLLIQRNS